MCGLVKKITHRQNDLEYFFSTVKYVNNVI